MPSSSAIEEDRVIFAPNNVRCNLLSPGPVLHKQPKDLKKHLLSRTPMGRLCIPKDLTGTLIYLSSKDSKFVTGQNILIDGGKTII